MQVPSMNATSFIYTPKLLAMILNGAGDFLSTTLEKGFKTRVTGVNRIVHFTHHLIASPRRLRSLRFSLAGAGLITEKCMHTCICGCDSGSSSSSVSNGNNDKYIAE